MKKIRTLFEKDPNDLGRVIDKVDPRNMWVYDKDSVPTRKFDGTSCAIIESHLYRRYDCKINKETGEYLRPIPEGAIPCQNADKVSGHHPHWIRCSRNKPDDKYHFEAFDRLRPKKEGTYELCGRKVQRNPEGVIGHLLIPHGSEVLPITDFSFDSIREYLSKTDIEGIVFHHKYNGLMCKIRKSDFGIIR